jgi:hypothetical protein
LHKNIFFSFFFFTEELSHFWGTQNSKKYLCANFGKYVFLEKKYFGIFAKKSIFGVQQSPLPHGPALSPLPKDRREGLVSRPKGAPKNPGRGNFFFAVPLKGPTRGSENFAQNVGPWGGDFTVAEKCPLIS